MSRPSSRASLRVAGAARVRSRSTPLVAWDAAAGAVATAAGAAAGAAGATAGASATFSSAAGAAAWAASPVPLSMTTMTDPTGMTWPSSARMSEITPAHGAVISTVALSVMTSTIG